MAHGPKSEASGLERDYRQDEFPTRYLGQQDEFPTAYNPTAKSSHDVNPPIIPSTISDLPLPKSAPKIQRRVCGLRASTFWLMSTVVILLILAGVGAGVLGSKISSKKEDTVKQERYVLSSRIKEQNPYGYPIICLKSSEMLKSYMSGIVYCFGASLLILSTVSTLSLSPSLASSSTSASTTSSASSSTTSPPSTGIQVVGLPKNDCKAVSPQYTIKSLDGKEINAKFDVSCDTGFYGGDIMSFYSPSLITCIRGCAMFNYWQTLDVHPANLNCSGIAYWPGINEEGNCWLKPGGYISIASQEKNATYAKLVL